MTKKASKRRKTMTATATPSTNGDTQATLLATYRRNNLRFYSTFRLHLYEYWDKRTGLDREQFANAAGVSDQGARFFQTIEEKFGEAGLRIIQDLTA